MNSSGDALNNAYKSFWLGLSRSERAKNALMMLPAAKRVKSRFIAGDTIDDAARIVGNFNGMQNKPRISGVMDFVGESVTSRDEAGRACETYCDILDAIKEKCLYSSIAVKPSQIGMDIDQEFCRKNLEILADHARLCDSRIEIDAEEDAKAGLTLEMYLDLLSQNYDPVIALQSTRRKSLDEARILGERGARVRLVKSAYREKPCVAYQTKEEVDANYRKIMAVLSERMGHNGGRLILGTHDEKMLQEMQSMVDKGEIDSSLVEIDMLLGIRNDRLLNLARQGYQTGVYVPFGSQWWAYTCRRIGERPANMMFVAKSLIC